MIPIHISALLILDMAVLDVLIASRFYRRRKISVVVSGVLLNIIAMLQISLELSFKNGENIPDRLAFLYNTPLLIRMILPLFLLAICILGSETEARRHYTTITRSSILNALNEMDTGLMYVHQDGFIALINRRMEKLSKEMFGKYPKNGNVFWNRIELLTQTSGCERIDFADSPSFLFQNGEVWSFSRKFISDSGRKYYEITARNLTDLYRQLSSVEEETLKLKSLQMELGKVLRSISETGNEEELLNYKIRIHDQLGNAILRTRKYLREPNSSKQDVEEILYVWENTIKAFEQNLAEVRPEEEGSLEEVVRQAEALGIELKVQGTFPVRNGLCVRAVREAMYNSIRHAYANVIIVDSYRAADGYHVRICDDGHVKEKTITEGGGLTSLRKAVEEVGGSMTVRVWEGVELNFFFPESVC